MDKSLPDNLIGPLIERLIVDKWDDGKKSQVAIAEMEDWIVEHHWLYRFALVTLDQSHRLKRE